MNSNRIRNKKSIRRLLSSYEYRKNIPERGLTINGKPALTQIEPEQAGDFVLLTVRDPLCNYSDDPATGLGAYLENPVLIGDSGMFRSVSGKYKGASVTVVSGGSGSPEMELALYDYMEHTTAHTFIRVGGSGGIGDEVRPGDVVISTGVVREDGMTDSYIPAGFPAVAHHELVLALTGAAEKIDQRYHLGTTLSVASDFVGCGRPGVGGYMQPWNTEIIDVYNRAGVLNGDRESAAVVTLSALFGLRGGSVCSVADNIVTGEKFQEGAGHATAIHIALEGCAILNEMDKEKQERAQQNWIPKLSGIET
jgi:uridine phosphorylase